jgi:hypothetical protein
MAAEPFYSCKFCDFTTKWETIFGTHLQSVHPTVSEVIENAAIVKKCNGRCPKCNKTFANKYYLPVHILKCAGQINHLTCVYCNKTFASSSTKSRHKNHCKALSEHNKYIEENPVITTSNVNVIDVNIKENLEEEVINRITASVEENIQKKLDNWIQKIKLDSINEIIETISSARQKV